MHISSLELPAPAKINHFLHICGRRDDGYHNLQTVFQFLDIADTLFFERREDGKIQLLSELDEIPNEENLIIRAARALQKASNSSYGADIRIRKILPMGAGLGGGSSNAATCLVALNHLWQLAYSTEQLQQIGVALGADVPIFIYGKSAWAEGIGEKLHAITLSERWYLLLIPPCHVSTAKIFSHPQLTRDTEMKTIAAFLEQGSQEHFHNDCEYLVRRLYPEVDLAFNMLSRFAQARMTGTGACVYASFANKQQAQQAADSLPADTQYFISKSSNLSPLYKALQIL